MTGGLHFRGNNPGAVQFGNFINYYQFNAPENRLELLPLNILKEYSGGTDKIFCLDVGCNAGDLTVKLREIIEKALQKPCFMLGLDIDATLIERAQEKSARNVTFCALDFMNEKERKNEIEKYMQQNKITSFNMVFCFSITMWIHLNHGDDGLEHFLENISHLGNTIIIEPQCWESYKTAVKRLRQAGEEFRLFKTIKYRNNVEVKIEEIMLKLQFKKLCETDRTKFKRKMFVFKINKAIV